MVAFRIVVQRKVLQNLTAFVYINDLRMNLIVLSGRAEGLLELEFATFLLKIPHPFNNLDLFPYYGNYVNLAGMEYKILGEHGMVQPKKVAFVGSGPLPLTSIGMATHHMKSTRFDNFDINGAANDVACHDEFEKRMKFVTRDIMDVR